jgi:multiple sugar transport system substrate-binding protein
MKKWMHVFLVMGLFLATALTGCSSKNGASGSSPSNNATGNNTEKVQLNMLWWGSQSRHDITKKVIDLFEQKHPNIQITPEYSGFDGYFDKLSVQVSGGSAPDIIQMSVAYLNDYVNRKVLLYLDNIGINLNDVDKGTLSTGQLNGKLYALPTGIATNAYIYDPAMLEKASVKLPDYMTWDDFAKITKQVSDKLGNGIFGAPDEIGTWATLEIFLRQRGMARFTDGKLGFTKEALADYFTYWTNLRKSGAVSSAAVTASIITAPLEKNPLITGKTPFTFLDSNQFVALAALAKRPLAMTFVPKTDGGKEGSFLTPPMYWSINSKTKHPKEAAQLLDFMTNDPEACKILGTDRGVPISSKIRNLLEGQASDLEKIQYEFVDKVSKIAPPINVIQPNGAGEVRNLFATTAQEVQFDKKTPEQAASEFVDKATAILAKAK